MGFSSNRRPGGEGVPTITVVQDKTVIESHLEPSGDVSHNLGSPTQRWSNVYTGDLHLRNERGDWTLFEEADKIMVKNNLTGELFNLMLEKIEK